MRFSDIVIIRNTAGYHVLYGHLRLWGALSTGGEAVVDVKGEGTVKVVKTAQGMFIKRKGRREPLVTTWTGSSAETAGKVS